MEQIPIRAAAILSTRYYWRPWKEPIGEPNEPGLLKTNLQVYREAVTMYYSCNTFAIDSFEQAIDMFKGIGPKKMAMLTSVHGDHDLRIDLRFERSLLNIDIHEDEFAAKEVPLGRNVLRVLTWVPGSDMAFLTESDIKSRMNNGDREKYHSLHERW